MTSYSIIVKQTCVFIMYYGDTSGKPCVVYDLDKDIFFYKSGAMNNFHCLSKLLTKLS